LIDLYGFDAELPRQLPGVNCHLTICTRESAAKACVHRRRPAAVSCPAAPAVLLRRGRR